LNNCCDIFSNFIFFVKCLIDNKEMEWFSLQVDCFCFLPICSFPALSCEFASVDVSDVLGTVCLSTHNSQSHC
jgi:hypothetical protein